MTADELKAWQQEDPQHRSAVLPPSNQLREERDREVPLTAAPRQQTIVGEFSGGGDRHVIDALPIRRSPASNPAVWNKGGTVDVATADASGYSPGAGVGSVDNVSKITFDSSLFEIYDAGGGEVVVKLKTCPATCP